MTLDTMGNRSLRDLLDERVEMYGERTFLVFEDGDANVSELTYAEFGARVEGCARGLTALGVGAGDNVVIHLPNSPEFLVAWFGLMRIGAVMVPSNTANAVPELEHIFAITEARVAITEPGYAEAIAAGAAAGGGELTLIVARGSAGDAIAFDGLPAMSAEPAPRPALGGDDLAQLLFTSGTTSKPKAVMLSHANCIRAGLDSVQALWLEPGERCLTALPLFHVNGQGLTILAAMTVGGTAIVLERFQASRFWSQVRRHGATQTALVAMQLRTLLAQPVSEGERDHQLRRVFYAINVTDAEKEEFEERYGVSLINGYGCSEAMTLIAVSPVAGPRRWPSIGLPAPGRRVQLVGEDGQEVAPGEVGEVVVHGEPGRSIMLGYFRDEEATAATIQDGRLHTGDNAYADENGFLYFFDRKKDMIMRAGENIAAGEVEAVLATHPDVAEVAVVGIADAIRDEAVAAVVVPREGSRPSAEELIEFCSTRLSYFKVPTTVVFESQLPKTSIGKVRKDALRKQLAA